MARRNQPPKGLPRFFFEDEFLADFWDYVDQSAGQNYCWPWEGKLSCTGYGYHGEGGRYYASHHIAHDTTFGPVRWGNNILHTCGLSLCTNPLHYRQGSASANCKDRFEHERQANSLTREDHKIIRELDMPWYLIAEEHGVAPVVIYKELFGTPGRRIKPRRVGGVIPRARYHPPLTTAKWLA